MNRPFLDRAILTALLPLWGLVLASMASPATLSAQDEVEAVLRGRVLRGDGSVLDMGTGFDDLRPQSHHGVTDIPAEAQRNRLILLGIMTAAGWDFYRNEWWHYQLFDSRRFASLTDVEAGTRMMAPG